MTTSKSTAPALERIADLKETLEKEKVTLTPEVEAYIRKHIHAVQDKLQNGEDVYEEDLAFIEQVKLWVRMPKQWREKYVSIEEMRSSEEKIEASKRGISLRQWLDVLHVAEAAGKSREWIDKVFTFPGGGKIEVKGHLNLSGCTSLTSLPAGLKVGGLYLTGCTSLTSLPEGLAVGASLVLEGCTSLTRLPGGLRVGGDLDLKYCTALTRLPEGLAVGGYLSLSGCTSLPSLPEGLAVGGDLNLNGCTSLTKLPEGLAVGGVLLLNGCTSLVSLPEGLAVGGDLYLSENLHEQVKKDAKRLKEEGKIKGRIIYE